MKSFSPIVVAHRFVGSVVQPGDFCVDATVGNGHDTCFLAKRVGEEGRVLGFDVQAAALESAKAALTRRQLADRVQLLAQGHETLGEALSGQPVPVLKAAMFNLGYWPGSDKTVITRKESTLRALEQSLHNLVPGGAISIVAYRAHEGGNDESRAVESWFRALPAVSYFCLRYERWSNRRGLNPVFLWIRRR